MAGHTLDRSTGHLALGGAVALETVAAGIVGALLGLVGIPGSLGVEFGVLCEPTGAAWSYVLLGFLAGLAGWMVLAAALVRVWLRPPSAANQALLVFGPLAFVALVSALAALVSLVLGPQPCEVAPLSP